MCGNTTVFEKVPSLLNGVLKNTVTREFLKKYISFSKSIKSPELHQDCIEYAAQFYSALRDKAHKPQFVNKVSMPVTVRTLETMIRLATAHSKLRLSKEVEVSDSAPYPSPLRTGRNNLPGFPHLCVRRR